MIYPPPAQTINCEQTLAEMERHLEFTITGAPHVYAARGHMLFCMECAGYQKLIRSTNTLLSLKRKQQFGVQTLNIFAYTFMVHNLYATISYYEIK